MSSKANKTFNNIIFIATCISNIISLVSCNCALSISEDISLRPNITRVFGSHKIAVILNKNDRHVTIADGQTIVAYCPTKFEGSDSNKIEATCQHGNLNVQHGRHYYGGNFYMQCSSQNWNLYETFESFVWCPSNTTSYLLARPIDFETKEYQYLAGICFDTHKFSVKTIYYTMSPKGSQHLSPTVLTNSYTPSLELKYLSDTFGTKSVIESDYGNQDVQDWLKYSQYNFSSLIQNTLLLNDFNEQLGSLADVAWWPNLRLGNWKRYERALASEVERQHQSYDIMVGISAVAQVPIIETCPANYTLKELVGNNHNTIPMYIWNYIKSTNNSSDEIVVIGFNSPFYEFYSEKDVIFCHDKCQEIPWLKNVSPTFRYSALGVMFCCSTQDVVLSNRLDGFPDIDLNTKPQQAVTVSPVKQEY